MIHAGIVCGPPLWAMTAWVGDLLVVGLVLAGIVRGSARGVFRTVLEGVAVAAGLLFGLVFAPGLARLCVAFDMPREIALGLAFLTLFLAPVIGLDVALRRRHDLFTIRHEPVIDAVAGGIGGALCAGLAAGGILIAWSMLPLPEALMVDRESQYLDAGRGVLTGFARTAEAAPTARRVMLSGEPWEGVVAGGRDVGDAGTAPVAIASDVFVDQDSDGGWDDDEAFIDADGDGSFSRRGRYVDLDGDGHRAIGWLERYRLGRWERVLSVPWVEANEEKKAGARAASDASDPAPQGPVER